jgi:diguanylate cyclase (GGDEF)-like protein/PAS domain S-box-containing protein
MKEREEERLRWVKACCIGDSPSLPEFEALAELAARLLAAKISIITVINEREHLFIANHGGHLRRVPRHGLCNVLIQSDLEELVVLDTTADPRCCDSPWVIGPPHLRFYAGVPLEVMGVRVGTLVVVDDAVRTAFRSEDRRTLKQLGAIASAMLSRRCATRSGQIAEDLVNATGIATVATDSKGSITLWNDSAEALFGWPRRDAIGKAIELIIPDRFRAAHAKGINRAKDGSRLSGSVVDLVGLHQDGRELAVGLSMSSWHGPNGVEFGAHMRDISKHKAEEVELRHQAEHDHLTGLLNRPAFKAKVEAAVASGAGAALLFIDVDRLKVVNHTLGHAVGDTLLQTFALRISAALPPGAIAARMGGDEFAILLPAGSLLEAHSVAGLVLGDDLVPGPEEVADLANGCSIGIAMLPLHAATAGELVVRADLAMIAAKHQGGRHIRLFDNSLLNQAAARQRLDDEMLLATRRGEWELHYQPQYDLADRRISGVEALLRWRHPERGLVMPAAFISELEQHLVSVEVGRWVLEEACRQLREWQDAGLPIPRVSVNLFDKQFRLLSLARDVSSAIERHALHPGNLEIEVTERIALDPSDTAMAALRDLRDAGVEIAFDDFGTGYASLTTIKQLPLSRLKIDKSFVRDVLDDRGSCAIIEGIAAIGRAMKLDIVAEGIERHEQVIKLLEAGCRHGQGYLLAKPMSASGIAELCVPKSQQLLK